jgi:hypothetical protein
MPEIDTNEYSDETGIDSHLRRVLTPTAAEAARIVVRTLERRRSTLRRVLVPVAAAIVLAAAVLLWQRTRDTRAARPTASVVTIGELIVMSTPSGGHWIVDRQAASHEVGGRHLVVRKGEVQ